MMRRLLTFVVFLAAFATSAIAKPLKLESENIVLYGDVDEKSARDIVRELEIYRRTIFAMVKKEPRAADVKLTIYSFDSSRPLAKYFGNKQTAGLYTIGPNGPVFFTSIKKSSREDTFEEQVAKHEFSHHVLHAIVSDDFPRWYDEGFANYLSSFKVEDDIITIGSPTVAHGAALERQRWMSPEDFFRSISLYPWAKRGEGRSQLVDSFYAQSWLYVHFMQNHSEFSSALPEYLKRLKGNVDPLDAFEGAFGISPQAFHNRAKKYFGANAFPVLQFKAEPQFLDVKIKAVELSEAELELAMLTGQRNILSEDNKKDYRKRLEAAKAGLGETPAILMAETRLSILDENFDEAVTTAESLSALRGDEIEVKRLLAEAYLGRSQMQAFSNLKDKDLHLYAPNADLEKAIKYYSESLTVNSKDRRTVQSIVSLFGRYESPLPAWAKPAVKHYEAEIFSGDNPHAMMNLATIYAQSGDSERACGYFKGALLQAKSEKSAKKYDLEARLDHFKSRHGQSCST